MKVKIKVKNKEIKNLEELLENLPANTDTDDDIDEEKLLEKVKEIDNSCFDCHCVCGECCNKCVEDGFDDWDEVDLNDDTENENETDEHNVNFPFDIKISPYNITINNCPANYCGNTEQKDNAMSAVIHSVDTGEQICGACICAKSTNGDIYMIEDIEAYNMLMHVCSISKFYAVNEMADILIPMCDNLFTYQYQHTLALKSRVLSIFVALLAITRMFINKIGSARLANLLAKKDEGIVSFYNKICLDIIARDGE